MVVSVINRLFIRVSLINWLHRRTWINLIQNALLQLVCVLQALLENLQRLLDAFDISLKAVHALFKGADIVLLHRRATASAATFGIVTVRIV